MCNAPITSPEGNTFACRTCDECVADRRADWVNRAMAEKSMHRHTTCLTLTYGSDNQRQRDGAAMFQYYDVREFLKLLRSHIFRRTGHRGAVRFLCAGEQGSRNGRCHWHIIIFSDLDITEFGNWFSPNGQVKGFENIVSRGKAIYRRRWTLWPHGFVVVQEPDHGGISYALKYALKDQFSTAKSKGTGRETKSEEYATGVFRMSKTPPIGAPAIEAQLAEWEENGVLPPTPQLPLAESKYNWEPRGINRERFLLRLREINERIILKSGRNAPQWSSLLQATSRSVKDTEILLGEEEEEQTSIEREIDLRSREGRERQRFIRVRTRCGSSLPCTSCLRSLTTPQLERLGVQAKTFHSGKTGFTLTGETSPASLWAKQSDRTCSTANARCGLRNTSYHQGVFPQQSAD